MRLLCAAVLLAACNTADGFGDRVERYDAESGPCTEGGTSDLLALEGVLEGATHWECRADPEAEGAPEFSGFAGLTTTVNGGSLPLQLFPDGVDDLATRDVYVAVSGRRDLFVTQVTPGADGRVAFDVQFRASAPGGDYVLLVAIDDGGTPDAQATGGWLSIPITIIPVAPGGADIQVNVNWRNRSGAGNYTDLDLHVVDPNGERVYFANPQVASGGRLDLDSNAACSPGDFNENIYWPVGDAVAGTYLVQLHYWSACSLTGPVDWRVTILRDGNLLRVIDGSVDEGDTEPLDVYEFSWD